MSGTTNGQGGQMSGYVGPPMVDPAAQLGANPFQYGTPLTTQFVQNQALLKRPPNQNI